MATQQLIAKEAMKLAIEDKIKIERTYAIVTSTKVSDSRDLETNILSYSLRGMITIAYFRFFPLNNFAAGTSISNQSTILSSVQNLYSSRGWKLLAVGDYDVNSQYINTLKGFCSDSSIPCNETKLSIIQNKSPKEKVEYFLNCIISYEDWIDRTLM